MPVWICLPTTAHFSVFLICCLPSNRMRNGYKAQKFSFFYLNCKGIIRPQIAMRVPFRGYFRHSAILVFWKENIVVCIPPLFSRLTSDLKCRQWDWWSWWLQQGLAARRRSWGSRPRGDSVCWQVRMGWHWRTSPSRRSNSPELQGVVDQW